MKKVMVRVCSRQNFISCGKEDATFLRLVFMGGYYYWITGNPTKEGISLKTTALKPKRLWNACRWSII